MDALITIVVVIGSIIAMLIFIGFAWSIGSILNDMTNCGRRND